MICMNYSPTSHAGIKPSPNVKNHVSKMSAFLMYIVCKCHLEAMERDLSDKDLGW